MLRCSPSILLLGATLAALPGQEGGRFEVRPAASYTSKLTADGVTVAVEVFRDRDKIKQAFPKTDLEKLGILPVLVVIANDNDHALQLNRMQVQLITSDRQEVDPTPGDDVLRTGRVERPEMTPRPNPLPIPRRSPASKRQRQQGEVGDREFVAPVVAARATAHGFFYFRLGKGPDRLTGAKLYLNGIRSAKTGQELLYFEIPLDR
jgi:hypothetical protein